MRLGLFGGTFDPPHTGHLIVAQDALRTLRLDRVVFVPAALPPHKRGAPLTDAMLRLAMVRAALQDDDRFAADDVELRRAGPSYTVDTLRAYRARFADAKLFLLIGADQFDEFDTWREAGEIRKLARLGVLAREGVSGSTVDGDGDGGVVRVAVTRIDISSTDIRRRVAAGEPIRYLVPAAVERIIQEQALYALPGDAGRPNRHTAAG